MHIFIDFLSAITIPIDKPRSYGLFHLSATAVLFFVVYLIGKYVDETKKDKVENLFFVCGILLLFFEFCKQCTYFFVVNNHTFDFVTFPFYLCSMPIYLCILQKFVKGKMKQSIYDFLAFYTLLGGFMAFLEPSSINQPYLNLTIHSYLWHFIIVLLGVILLRTKIVKPTATNLRSATVMLFILSAVAIGLNYIFNEMSGYTIRCFFLGPNNSTIIVFKQICELCGWPVGNLVYEFALILGGCLIMSISKRMLTK